MCWLVNVTNEQHCLLACDIQQSMPHPLPAEVTPAKPNLPVCLLAVAQSHIVNPISNTAYPIERSERGSSIAYTISHIQSSAASYQMRQPLKNQISPIENRQSSPPSVIPKSFSSIPFQ
jgi:hypothetical protein